MNETGDLPHCIALQGASNLRDLGGWLTSDGRRVRRGRIYRSAALSALTAPDLQTLAGLRVRHICDLRGDVEREKSPSRVPAGAVVHALGIAPTIGASLRDLIANRAATRQDVMEVMQQAYGAYASDWHHRYRAMFDLLLRQGDDGALLFHCTAGKDRTGFGAALILAALGVPEEAIRADYLATNRLWAGDPELAASLPPVVAQTLLRVFPEFLDAAFAAVRAEGGMETYLARRIGLTPPRRAQLRARYTE